MKKDVNVEVRKLVKLYGIKQILSAMISYIKEIGNEDYLHKLASGLASVLVNGKDTRLD